MTINHLFNFHASDLHQCCEHEDNHIGVTMKMVATDVGANRPMHSFLN
jgi:hypothetical protein